MIRRIGEREGKQRKKRQTERYKESVSNFFPKPMPTDANSLIGCGRNPMVSECSAPPQRQDHFELRPKLDRQASADLIPQTKHFISKPKKAMEIDRFGET